MATALDCIVEVMAAEGTLVDADDMIVTTGGQQVIDLVCKTLLDPGDVVVAEAPTYPGAVPSFGAYQADVVQIEVDDDGHAHRRCSRRRSTGWRRRAAGRSSSTRSPTSRIPAGVTMSLPRRRRLVEVARERELLVLEDNPYGLLRYEGEPLPTLYSLDASVGRARRRLGPRDLPRHLLEDPRRPGCAWAGRSRRGRCSRSSTWASRARTCAPRRSASCSWPRTSAREAGATTCTRSGRSIGAGATRCSTRSPSTSRPRRDWTRPQGGMFIWATLPDYIDTTDLLGPGAGDRERRLRARPGRLPRRAGRLVHAAELLRRRRGQHPRGRAPHRQGRGRAGRHVRHADRRAAGRSLARGPSAPTAATETRAPAPASERCAPGRSRPLADVVALPRRGAAGEDQRAAATTDEARRGAQGRALAGAPGLAALGRARAGRARAPRPRAVAIDVGHDLVSRCARRRPTWRSSRCTAATARTGPCRSCWRSLGIPYTGSGVSACIRCADKVLAKHVMRDAGIPTPDFYCLQRDRLQGARRRRRAAGDRGAPRLPDRGQAGRPGLGARGSSSRATAAEVPAALVAAFSYDRKVLLERHVRGPRPRGVGDRVARRRRRWRCRWSRRCRARRTSTTSSRAMRSAARPSCAPPSSATSDTRRAQELALATYRLLGCFGFARVDLMLADDGRIDGERSARCSCWRPTRSPGSPRRACCRRPPTPPGSASTS